MDDPPSSQDVKDVVWDHSSTTVHSSSPQNHKSLYDLAKLRAIFSSSTTSNTTTVESDEKAQILSFPSSHNDREEGDEEEQVRKRKQPASPTYPFDSPNESKSSSEKQKGTPTKRLSSNETPHRPQTRSLSRRQTPPQNPTNSTKPTRAPTKSPTRSTPPKDTPIKSTSPTPKKATKKTPNKTTNTDDNTSTAIPTTRTPNRLINKLLSKEPEEIIDLTADFTIPDSPNTLQPLKKGRFSLAAPKTPQKTPKPRLPIPIPQLSAHHAARSPQHKQPLAHITIPSPSKRSKKSSPPALQHPIVPQTIANQHDTAKADQMASPHTTIPTTTSSTTTSNTTISTPVNDDLVTSAPTLNFTPAKPSFNIPTFTSTTTISTSTPTTTSPDSGITARSPSCAQAAKPHKPSTLATSPSLTRNPSEVVIAKTDLLKKRFERFLVMEVSFERFRGSDHVWGSMNVSKPSQHQLKVLRIFNELTLTEKYITLEGDWSDTPAQPGHIVHILATFDQATRHAYINNESGIIVLHPDVLISGTSVSSSFSCMRRAVLNERIKDGGSNAAATYGSIVHGLLQTALTCQNFSPEALKEATESTLRKSAFDLAVVGESDQLARDKLFSYIPAIAAWGKSFITDTFTKENCIDIARGKDNVCITKVLEVEESVWSPTYGLKGKIDATLEVKTTNSTWNENKIVATGNFGNQASTITTRPNNIPDPHSYPTLTVPLEIKTGSDFDGKGHKAQLLLYDLLLSDRYAQDINAGLLFYIRTNNNKNQQSLRASETSLGVSNEAIQTSTDAIRTFGTVRSVSDPSMRTTTISSLRTSNDVPLRTSSNRGGGENQYFGTMRGIEAKHNEIRSILIARNALANYLYEYSVNPEQSDLPALIRDPFTCNRCYVSEACMIYHKAYENGDPASSGVEELFVKTTSHLSNDHLQYFKIWDQCISWEASFSINAQKDIWAFSSKDRENQGKCFSNMVLLEEVASTRGYEYMFSKLNGRDTSTPDSTPTSNFFNLLDQQINVGDYICVSTEAGEFGLGTGTIKRLSLETVVVSCSDKISQPLAAKQGGMSRMFVESSELPPVMWRIDKNEVGSGFSTARTNLLRLFSSNDALATKRRQLIVDLDSPTFETPTHTQASQPLSPLRPPLTSSPARSPSRYRWASHVDFTQLNVDQRKAINAVLSAKDYALILGMPGTGKTTTIALMVKAVLMEGKSILITSYTHSAVDNLLLKLAELKIDFLRLGGTSEQIHPDLRKYTLGYQSLSSIAAIEAFLLTKKIVATTCLGINAPLLARRMFDFCVVDEASQITLPVCLGPLRFASVFVLVGDQYQLPPLVRSQEARAKGLDQSLFKRLSEAHPEAVSTLQYQYRMNSDIMLISNTLIYAHRLRCGTSGVAKSQLVLNIPNSQPRTWIDEVIVPNRSVIFLNTDLVPAPESRSGNVIKNDVEGVLVAQIADVLLHYGLAPSDLGIISPYRSQLKVIRQLLVDQTPHSQIEVHTVDKFQGRDKDCIIVSLVCSNQSNTIGELLKDWRRVNVAFTRAKKKLIVIGSLATLQSTHLFSLFIELVTTNNWKLYNLPVNAHMSYKRVNTTQASTSPQEKKREKKTFGLASARRSILKNILDAL